MISLDTETTGVDPWHGSKPFLVTTCDDEGNQITWEWDVDPFTRMPQVDFGDLEEIQSLLHEADRIVLQHATFDIRMLEALCGDEFEGWEWDEWPWYKTHDTLLSAHLLASCQRKDLTTQALVYLHVNVKPYEDDIEEATTLARRICRLKAFKEKHGEWAIAKEDRPDMPTKGKLWKADMWLPKAIVKNAPEFLPEIQGWTQLDPPQDHPWFTRCVDYADSDSEVTLPIHKEHMKRVESEELNKLYEERRKLLKLVHNMKHRGITLSASRRNELVEQYEKETEAQKNKCINLAGGPDRLSQLPVNGVSNELRRVVFDDFGLEPSKTTKKGNPSMDKNVVDDWLDTLPRKSKPYHFLKNLKEYRQRSTALSYMKSYSRFWLPVNAYGEDGNDNEWYRLHASLNPTGTNTLRWSSANPNQQNISKKEGFNLRYCFGPAPGRCWAALDYENIELRIPAYESGEDELIELFENPDAPPYYGSKHLLNFETVYPDIWEKALKNSSYETVAPYIRKHYKSTWYQRCKNGGFAIQYGAIERDDRIGTADAAFGRVGCHRKLKERFSKQEELNQHWIQVAEETGFVETIPDMEVDPDQGYPLQCSRTKYGNISPTIPLNYHVQGTACWVIMRAMLKVQEYLDEINSNLPKRHHWFITMQVHDELVIDFARIKHWKHHLSEIRKIMESCGKPCINVPLRVGCDIHEDNWAESYSLAV